MRPGQTTACWNWTGCQHKKGYGQVKFDGKTWWAHRLAWLIFRGPPPAGKDLHHRCENEECVNPDHLEPVAPSPHGTWSNRRRRQMARTRKEAEAQVADTCPF
jgi:hypothetical protein